MTMRTIDPELRRLAHNYKIDGESGPNQRFEPSDGFLSVREIAHGLARLRRLYEAAKDPERARTAPLPAERYAKMIDLLVAALPLARDAEALGRPGMKYMQEPFYKMAEEFRQRGLSRYEIDKAINGDINFGNNDGIVSRDEYCRASWYPGRTTC